jgi:hypothetical protein
LHFALGERNPRVTVMMPNYTLWWILGAAAALAGLWVVRVFGASLDTDMFTRFIKKCINDKNVSRALKLCAAAGEVPLGKAIKAALLASVSREEDTNRPASYRGNRPVSMDAVRERIRARYDAAFTQSMTRVKQSFYIAIPAPILFVCVGAFALTQLDPDWKIIGTSGAGLLFCLYVAWAHNKIVSSRNAGFDALWPSFEAVYHDRLGITIDDKTGYPRTNPATTNENHSPISLEILEPGKPLRSLTFHQPVIKIGSLATSHLQISAEGVTRLHAVIEIADGKATIIDLGAKRPTTVNGENVTKQELANGDVIGIGDAEIVVRSGASDVTSS